MAGRAYAPFWLLPVTIVLSAVVVMLAVRSWFLTSRLPEEQLLALRLVYEQIVEDHVDPPPPEELMWSAIEGMVGALDEHSAFVRPAKVAAFEEDTTGRYAGIGVLLDLDQVPVRVRFPFPDGPAERAGLRPGDRLLAADGEPLAPGEGSSVRERVQDLLLGPPGTTVTVTVARGDDEREFELERAFVQKPSVKWARTYGEEPRIGYLYLAQFQSSSAEEVAAAIAELEREAPLDGLVLDLRYDPGGLLEEAVAVANLFVPEGTIVSVVAREGAEVQRHAADPARCIHPDLPLAVLVNDSSASASEVLAGALQDHGRARLIGTHTYGKGLVQSIFRWSGLDFRLKLTTAVYTTPSGRRITRGRGAGVGDGDADGGIAPDVEVSFPAETAPQLHYVLQTAIEPPPRWRDEVARLAATSGSALPRPPPPEEDPQLAAALDTLR